MTATFPDAQAVYDRFGGLFQTLVADAAAAQLAKASKLIVRFRFKTPEAEILLNCRKEPVDVKCGKTQTQADLDLTVTASGLHRMLLGELDLTAALKAGELKARGALLKVKSLGPIFDAAMKLYPG